jgi:Flp pilus assembly protein TadG
MFGANSSAKQITIMNDMRGSPLVRLLRDERGSFVPIFAVTLLVLIAMIGMGIDYTRASFANAKMQAALDATALAISQNAATVTSSALTSEATTLFSSIYTGSRLTSPTITATYSNTGGPQVVMTATASMPTTFLNLPPVKISSINLSASSTIAWGQKRLRVALVLDNTGSMADSGKMTALQTATKNLLNQLKSVAVNAGDVYVSIIPFVKDVNVGSSYSGASWIDWTDWEANNGTCSRGNATTKSSCTNNGYTWTPAAHSTWNGCVTDRGNTSGPSTANYDENVNPPVAGNTASMFPSEQYDSCPLQMKGLSYDWTTMTSMVNQMSPNGNTNQAIGLVWGWMSLVGGGPFTVPAMDSNFQYQQIIILLTDGLNTQNRWYSNASQIDPRQQATCNNIHNLVAPNNIKIYAVQVDTGGDPTSTLLQNCASPPDSDSSQYFFLLTSATEIVTTFQTIANNISKLHIAK